MDPIRDLRRHGDFSSPCGMVLCQQDGIEGQVARIAHQSRKAPMGPEI
jgi:hypothetical protein